MGFIDFKLDEVVDSPEDWAEFLAFLSIGSYHLTSEQLDEKRMALTLAAKREWSEAFTQITAAPSGIVEVAVSPVPRQRLKARKQDFTPNPTAFHHQWYRNGVPINGATDWEYQVTDDDIGSELSVEVTALLPDRRRIEVTSEPTLAVTP